MVAKILGDVLSHINARGLGAKDGNLIGRRIYQTQRRWCQRNGHGLVFLGMNMSDGQFGPRLVDKSMEEAELIIPLDSDMFRKGLLLCRRLDQYILPVK